AAGMKPGELPEVWNITHGDIVADIHASYVRAGANILKSNTFGANAMKLQGSGYSVEEVVLAAFENARKAFRDVGRAGQSVPGVSEDKQFTALDLGPTGKLLAPFGDLQFEDAVALYAETVRAGVKAKADLVLIETMSDTYEAKAAILAAKENSDLPIFVTFTFDKDGKLLNGADVETAVLMAEGLGVDAVGFNCGLGPDLVAKLMPRARAVTCLPLIANPNAGLPVEKEGKTVFTTGPEDFAEYMLDVYKEGASVLGGCCGTNPEYIRLVAERTQGLQPVQAAMHSCGAAGKRIQASGIIPADKDSTAFYSDSVTAVTGYGAPVYFGKQPVLIGERINPTGKPLLKDALRNNDMDYVCRLGLEQLDCGANILDVNTGLPGLDEAVTLAGAVTGLQAVTPAPLEIDTSNYEAMEKALRLYNGKPLLNSVNGKKESMEKVFPLAKKYGAAVVGLCLDETGIPDTAEGRLAIAEKILATASDYGIQSKDIIIDPLALTVSTDSRNPAIDIAVIKALKEKGIHTVMGVSNISFGLPNRDGVNSTFFAMSLAAGLSSAIMNPPSDRMMETYRAFCALSGADEGCKDFVARYADMPKTKAAAAVSEYTLYDAIVKGLAEQSGTATKKLLEEKTAPLDIINNF
ncbi:MAG: homocysteine S-methyltransferase family protein, partial [Acidaminococcaceae bacterium]|nr:homocysteine S-methyltransferase family protein [Acidaminococcaceae bacterium]